MGKAVTPYQGPGSLAAWVAAPLWALARGVTSMLSPKAPSAKVGASAYEGAVHSRLTWDWTLAPILSANQELRYDHRTLVARSRELVRNDPHARRFIGLVETNVIGHHGIRLQAQVRDTAGDLDRETNSAIEDAWADWGRPEYCTMDGRLDLVGFQRAAIRAWGRDGEALARMIPAAPNPYGFAVQLLDADQLDLDFNDRLRDGSEIRMGVEMDRWGRPVAYHFWTHHPTEHGTTRKRERIPAAQVLHYYDVDRPGQARGVPRMANILQTLRMLHGYREAEVVAARIAASKMGFFEVDPEAVDNPATPGAGASLDMEAEPGKLGELPPGYSFSPWDPQHPTSAFGDFEKAILRSLSVGTDMAYASLTGDLSDANYSSIRTGALTERDFHRLRQHDFAKRFLGPLYRSWIRWAVTTGALALPMTRLADLTAHTWRPRGFPWVDPQKDIQSHILAIQHRLDSRTSVIAETGKDIEEVFEEILEEEELAEEWGVDLPTASSAPASPPPRPADDQDGRAAANGKNRLTGILP